MTKKENKKLRKGFTTGTAAAAAVKGALLHLLTGEAPERVQISLLTGDPLVVAIHSSERQGVNRAEATVIKDAGDDPDVTHKARIGARVSLPDNSDPTRAGRVIIAGGEGVGRVTRPGLEIPPGEPAINPGPRKMIRQAMAEVFEARGVSRDVSVEIFVPEGERLAQKTLNARLGILGGISILGTTGVVTPMSHDAYIATIRSAMSVARASGLRRAALTTGRRSERFARLMAPELPGEAFIQIGDFFQMSLETASEMKFREILLTVFFGKAVKMAQGVPHTHAAKSSLTLQRLADWTLEATKNEPFSEEIRTANTARRAFTLLSRRHPEIIARVGRSMVESAQKFAAGEMRIRGVIFDFDGKPVFDSGKSDPGQAGGDKEETGKNSTANERE
ncbi:MAG: cobalt-precorrin-5B (C(1))-methyltransferase [Desulfobacterales bacterium]|nr:cobalt-precorrin-5B (C(1))-methyltransferase [Desulfobacterales bacterium]